MKEQPTPYPPAGALAERSTVQIRKYKFFNILVNGRMRLFSEKNISFAGVVALAFNAAAAKKGDLFRVSFRKGDGRNPEGVMKKGDVVAVRPGMVFKVEPLTTP